MKKPREAEEGEVGGVGAVVFDWAGTLIDHGSRAPVMAFVEAFLRHGVELRIEEARGPMGMAKRAHIAALGRLERVAAQWEERHGEVFGEAAIDAIYADFRPIQQACLAEFSSPIAGAAEAVSLCRERGIRVGSTTGYTREMMEEILPLAAAGGIGIESVFCASDVAVGRPAPWLIYRCCEELGVYPMRRVVNLDNTVAGVEAARHAGCWSVGITRTGNLIGLSEEEWEGLGEVERGERLERAEAAMWEAGADFVIASVADLGEVLDRIQVGGGTVT